MQVLSIVDCLSTNTVLKLQTPVVVRWISHKLFPEQVIPFCKEEEAGVPWP